MFLRHPALPNVAVAMMLKISMKSCGQYVVIAIQKVQFATVVVVAAAEIVFQQDAAAGIQIAMMAVAAVSLPPVSVLTLMATMALVRTMQILSS